MPRPTPGRFELQELSATLFSLRGYLGCALGDVQKDAPELVPQFNSLRAAIETFRKEMLRGDTNRLATSSLKLAEFQRSLFNDIHGTFQALQNQDDRAPLSIGDLPTALRDRFIGVTGRYLLMVYRKDDLWKREAQKSYIAQVVTVDPAISCRPAGCRVPRE